MKEEIARLERRRADLAAARRRLLEALADLPPGHPLVSDILSRIDRIDEEIRRIDNYIALLKAQERARQQVRALSEMTAGVAPADGGSKAATAMGEADRVLAAATGLPPEWDW